MQWLMAQQQPDHLWHSQQYGNLKEGAAVTALALYACSYLQPKELEAHLAALQASCDALTPAIEQQGCVANLNSRDYPTYATAMFLIAVGRLHLRFPPDMKQRLIDYLIESQIDQGEGYSPNDPDFGGWDLEGSSGGPRTSTGTNISVGAMVAEMLAAQSDPRSKIALEKYRAWLAHCQNFPDDGGFFFHAQKPLDGNKAGWMVEGDPADRSRPRSYGSATADGLSSLLACDPGPDSAHIRAAVSWLEKHSLIANVPGFEDSPDQSWADGLKFYYWFALAKSLSQFSDKARSQFARDISSELATLQAADGHWQNANARMREDDPLIATAFAIIALSIVDQETRDDRP